MATMKDVARHAGVSAATVCRVINNNVYVKPVTRERVETAMREFNYQRNVTAHAMAKRSGKTLGLFTGNLDDPSSRVWRVALRIPRVKPEYSWSFVAVGIAPSRKKLGLIY